MVNNITVIIFAKKKKKKVPHFYVQIKQICMFASLQLHFIAFDWIFRF